VEKKLSLKRSKKIPDSDNKEAKDYVSKQLPQTGDTTTLLYK